MAELDANQIAASKAMHRIARMNMAIIADACADEDAGLGGTIILPILILAAVRDKTLLGSVMFNDQRMKKEAAAHIARRSADHLDSGAKPNAVYRS